MNQTIETQLNHRSIRKFKDISLTKVELQTLYDVARHTSTSMFLQQFSILHITDEKKREKIRELCNQPYVGAEGDLFIFVVDLYRNTQIRRQLGKDDGRMHTFDVFFQGVKDTLLAAQNVMNAVESMGKGAVFLGTVNDHPMEMLEVLDLPEMTYPILGMQIGVPDQEPQLKPRLPIELLAFENEYSRDFSIEKLSEYDSIVETYYDLRNANKRIDSFTKQISGLKLASHQTDRDQLVKAIKKQKLALDI